MPMQWNADADAKLFAAVLATSDVKVNYAAVATMMGPECTAKAITHRVGAIKAKAKEAGMSGPPADTTTPPKAAPRKRDSKTAKVHDTVDDNGELPPAKKKKVNAPKSKGKTTVKAEPQDEKEVKIESRDEDDQGA